MGSFLHDLRVVVRQLMQRPGFTAVAVLTLAIGVGVNTVAFSVVNGVLFKGPAAAARPDVGRVLTTPGSDEEGNASLEEYQRLAAATDAVLDLAAEGRAVVAWRRSDRSDPVYALFISRNYFSMVDAEMRAGQAWMGQSGDGVVTAVIGERFWRDKLGSPALTGLRLQLNGVEVVVAGIMRETYTGPAGLYSPDVWLSLEDLQTVHASAALTRPDARWLFLIGKVLPDATVAAVQGHLDAAMATLAREHVHAAERGARFRLMSERAGELRGISVAASIGMGVIGLILLLACFNVANLLLSRALERERDMGIRTALGARPGRLIRLVLIEGALLAALSGVLAVMLAWWTQSLISTFAIPIEVPQYIDFRPDYRVSMFVLALVCVAGVLPGLWPAFSAARVDVNRVLSAQGGNGGSDRPSAIRRGLVGAQIAGSTAFLAIAALFIQSYAHLLDVDLGFAHDRLIVIEVDPRLHGHTEDGARRYADGLAEHLGALPGVAAVAVADRAPFFIGFERTTMVWPVSGTCVAGGCPQVATYAVESGYFRTLGIPIVAGRELSLHRPPDEVIVNQSFALDQWPDGEAVGRTLRLGTDGRVVTVVGITGSTRIRGLDREQPALFVPLRPSAIEHGLSVVVRTAGAPDALLRRVAETASQVDPDVPVLSLKTMEQRMAVQLWPFRTLSLAFAICGMLALTLAVVGLAGVVVHAVGRRTREFGVRMAIGARPRDLKIEVLQSSASLLIPGLLGGLLIAAAVARVAQALFVGVNVLNPTTYLVVALLQTAIVMGACLLPAARAARIDPLAALRTQ